MGPEGLQWLGLGAPAAAAVRRIGDTRHRRIHADVEDFGGAGQLRIFAVMEQIGTIAPQPRDDRLAAFRMRPDVARQAQEPQRIVQIEILGRNILRDRRALRLLAIAELDIRSEPAAPLRHLEPAFGIGAERFGASVGAVAAARLREFARKFALGIVAARDEGPEAPAAQCQPSGAAIRANARIAAVALVGEEIGAEKFVERRGDLRRLLLHHLAGTRLEVAPEAFEYRLPLGAPARDIVELFFEPRGEIIFDIAAEEAFEESGEQPPALFGQEAVLFDAHIGAVLEYLQDRGIGRRASDAELLHLLDEACFRIARRGLGFVRFDLDSRLGRGIALRHRGEQARVVVLAAVVAALIIKREEAREFDDLPGRAEHRLACSVAQVDAGAFEPRRGHLARQRTLPDQIVEARMIAAADLVLAEIGRTDRLVRFLRVLRFGLILARLVGNIAAVVAIGDRPPRGADRAAVHLNAVGTHVSDRAVLIEILRDPHRVAGRKAELARGFLLQGRCREGRRRIARQRLGFDAVDGEMPRLHIGFGGVCIGFVGDRQALDLVAAPARESRLERRAAHFELARDRPILLRNKGFDFAFAFDDEAQRHRLDAARRFGAGQLPPQHWRQGETDEIVERAARAVRVDQIVVEAARMRHRIGYRLLGDRVEGHAVDLLRQRLFLAQQFLHVPADRLALAIGVGRENQTVGLLRGVLNILQSLCLVGIELPLH